MKPEFPASGKIFYASAPSPFGALRLFSDGAALIALDQPGSRWPRQLQREWKEDENLPVFRQARAQLAAYFAGESRVFNLPLNPGGTPFQGKIWHALMQIPYGKTESYSGLAGRVKNPAAARAVAMANARNPLPIIIPCHRIIGRNGALTGYSGGGLARKAALLRLEGVAAAA